MRSEMSYRPIQIRMTHDIDADPDYGDEPSGPNASMLQDGWDKLSTDARTNGVEVITMDKFLSTFEPRGLVRRGSSYRSPGYDQATRHLDIEVTTAVGGVTVDWLE